MSWLHVRPADPCQDGVYGARTHAVGSSKCSHGGSGGVSGAYGKYLYVGRCVEPDVWLDIYCTQHGKIVGAIRQAKTEQGWAVNAVRYKFTTRLQFNAFRQEVVLPIMQERHAKMIADGTLTAEQAAENEHQLRDITLDAKTGEPVDA